MCSCVFPVFPFKAFTLLTGVFAILILSPIDFSQLHQEHGKHRTISQDAINLMNFLEPQGQPFINGCFNWMIPNLYIGNGWKSPFPSIFKWLFGVPG